MPTQRPPEKYPSWKTITMWILCAIVVPLLSLGYANFDNRILDNKYEIKEIDNRVRDIEKSIAVVSTSLDEIKGVLKEIKESIKVVSNGFPTRNSVLPQL